MNLRERIKFNMMEKEFTKLYEHLSHAVLDFEEIKNDQNLNISNDACIELDALKHKVYSCINRVKNVRVSLEQKDYKYLHPQIDQVLYELHELNGCMECLYPKLFGELSPIVT